MNRLEYPLVSCIVTSYNKIKLLYEAIDSVLEQDYPKIELLLTDDCSPDFNIDEFKKYIEANKSDNIVRYVVHKQEQNVGTVKNTNSMLNIARGEYFVGLDGDDVLYNNHVISAIVERFRQTGAEYLACSRCKCDQFLNPIGFFPTEEQKKTFMSAKNWQDQLGHFAVFDFLEIDAHVFSRRVVEKLGAYDERFRQWQDGPRLVHYVETRKMIFPAFDIVYIKYRQGGVSNAPGSNSESLSHLTADKNLFIELVTIPNKQYCNKKKFNKVMLWYQLGKPHSSIKKIELCIRYPLEVTEMLIQRNR